MKRFGALLCASFLLLADCNPGGWTLKGAAGEEMPLTREENEQAETLPVTCGKEEHAHTEECYTRELICGKEESEPVTEISRAFAASFQRHKHTPDCYTDGKLTCGYAENVYYHTHNEYCLDEEGELCCGLQTVKPHAHTDECTEKTGF